MFRFEFELAFVSQNVLSKPCLHQLYFHPISNFSRFRSPRLFFQRIVITLIPLFVFTFMPTPLR